MEWRREFIICARTTLLPPLQLHALYYRSINAHHILIHDFLPVK